MIQKNYWLAQEEFPEFFGSVIMLYIEAKLNGVDIKAFVDSGAQATIISKSLADKIGLSYLIDTRCSRLAQGVGTTSILGRIHAAELEIQSEKITCSLDVIDNFKVDFIFGLDNLMRYSCYIDLKENMLHMQMKSGEMYVPFLYESEIKKKESEDEKGEEKKQNDDIYKEDDVKCLMEIGSFPREKVITALKNCNGDIDQAANQLL